MKKEEIVLGDWKRIFIGEAPATFLVEVIIRTALVYTFLLIIMKLLGKRMSGQTTIAEMSVIILLGSIIAPAFQIPDRGILLSFVILICILFSQKTLNYLTVKKPTLEYFIQGREKLLVKDGKIDEENLRDCRITHDQLFEELRKRNIYHLGKVKRVYIEACGLFSVFTDGEHEKGQSMFPEKDKAIQQELS